jgi:predicted signal transduction protein with EAL and GGDEF domain
VSMSSPVSASPSFPLMLWRHRTDLARSLAGSAGVALDDFATGFSSFAHLRQLPLTELKIDRLFVAELLADDEAGTIVGTEVLLARHSVCGGRGGRRGPGHARASGDDDYNAAQGWFYGRPVPEHQLWSRLSGVGAAQWRPAPTSGSNSTASTFSGGKGREK